MKKATPVFTKKMQTQALVGVCGDVKMSVPDTIDYSYGGEYHTK